MTLRSRVLGWVLCVAVALLPALAQAQSEMANQVKLFLDAKGVPGGEVEITVGEPDPRLQLAPCRAFEPFVPTGARLWGKTSLGVRCTDGANWTIYVPTHIRVFAPGLVAARALTRGQAVTAEDFQVERVEMSALPAGVLAATDPPEGKLAARNIAAGEVLRRDFFVAPTVFQPGDAVRVLAGGRGFSISTEGKALTSAREGQTAQAALGQGRVVTGVARAGKIIEMR